MYARLPLGAAALWFCLAAAQLAEGALRAGAAAVDISPRTFPVIQNGGFLEATATRLVDPLHARCLVLDDGNERLAMIVVDSCMIPRELSDEIKTMASRRTGIRTDRIMLSATHCHTAPSLMDHCLGSRADVEYLKIFPGLVIESLEQAIRNLAEAEVGWGAIDAGEFTHCRRWIFRPDKMQEDPFGERTVRANMHPGHVSVDAVGPTGPADPWLTVLSVRHTDGTPLALLANFSMHYFSGHPGISADYFGQFAAGIAARLAGSGSSSHPPFVGLMSQGTSGDLWWGDYSRPPQTRVINEFSQQLIDLAHQASTGVEYQRSVSLAMAEGRLRLGMRTPTAERLQWARRTVSLMQDERPRDRTEVYALQAIYLHEHPRREIVLQAIRIGEFGIAAIPNEVYGLTGLKLKLRSPLQTTMNIELANGADGYIPPPEQHRLGGYNTWPATTAGLEVQAEPKIVDRLLSLLEEVSGRQRKDYREPLGPYAQALLAEQPAAYYRLAELEGDIAFDARSPRADLQEAKYVGNFCFHLPGVPASQLLTIGAADDPQASRSVQSVGGRIEIPWHATGNFSVEFWFWNGMLPEARAVTGTLVSWGDTSVQLSGNTDTQPGRLIGAGQAGSTQMSRYEWHHLLVSRDQSTVSVFLDGADLPEIQFTPPAARNEPELIVVGGGHDGFNFEGRLDEVACFPVARKPADLSRLSMIRERVPR